MQNKKKHFLEKLLFQEVDIGDAPGKFCPPEVVKKFKTFDGKTLIANSEFHSKFLTKTFAR